jgi:hypothetical protein
MAFEDSHTLAEQLALALPLLSSKGGWASGAAVAPAAAGFADIHEDLGSKTEGDGGDAGSGDDRNALAAVAAGYNAARHVRNCRVQRYASEVCAIPGLVVPKLVIEGSLVFLTPL